MRGSWRNGIGGSMSWPIGCRSWNAEPVGTAPIRRSRPVRTPPSSRTSEPNETILCPPTVCGCCAGDLSDASVEAEQRRQVREIAPPPPPRTIEYRVQAKVCGACGATNVGTAPAHAKARASYGPDTHAQACSLVVGHYLPIGRAVAVLRQVGGIIVSTGWMASVRGKAAGLLEPFMDHV